MSNEALHKNYIPGLSLRARLVDGENELKNSLYREVTSMVRSRKRKVVKKATREFFGSLYYRRWASLGVKKNATYSVGNFRVEYSAACAISTLSFFIRPGQGSNNHRKWKCSVTYHIKSSSMMVSDSEASRGLNKKKWAISYFSLHSFEHSFAPQHPCVVVLQRKFRHNETN